MFIILREYLRCFCRLESSNKHYSYFSSMKFIAILVASVAVASATVIEDRSEVHLEALILSIRTDLLMAENLWLPGNFAEDAMC